MFCPFIYHYEQDKDLPNAYSVSKGIGGQQLQGWPFQSATQTERPDPEAGGQAVW